jgi:hypothetical protein
MRRSHQVALVLLGTAGVVGLALVYDGWRTSSNANDPAAANAAPPPVPVSGDRMYANNEYIPGIGYYHAPYHAWFPHPYNYYDPVQGYFAGGLWRAMPWVATLSPSQPSSAAVAAALAAQRRQEEQRQQARSSLGGRSGFSGGWFSSARPAGSAPSAHPSIIRGGFGSFGHSSGG